MFEEFIVDNNNQKVDDNVSLSEKFDRLENVFSPKIFGIPVYRHEHKLWAKLTIVPLNNMREFFDDFIYSIRYRFFKKHQHHIVYTDLEPGWHDKDEIILHANFSILVKFVEEEWNDKNVIKNEFVTKEITELYNWWTQEYRQYNADRDACYETEQIMLMRLLTIRKDLWV